jgi:hypothetical protein
MANKNIMDHEGKSTAQELPLNKYGQQAQKMATQSSIAKVICHALAGPF